MVRRYTRSLTTHSCISVLSPQKLCVNHCKLQCWFMEVGRNVFRSTQVKWNHFTTRGGQCGLSNYDVECSEWHCRQIWP